MTVIVVRIGVSDETVVGLRGGIGGEPRRSLQVPRGSAGLAAGGARLHHRDLAAHPGARLLDRVPRSAIVKTNRLEEVEHVLGAGRSPERQEAVVGIFQCAATPDRDEARVADLWEDHRRII